MTTSNEYTTLFKNTDESLYELQNLCTKNLSICSWIIVLLMSDSRGTREERADTL